MAQKVDLQERLKMRFLTVDYRDKQETYVDAYKKWENFVVRA